MALSTSTSALTTDLGRQELGTTQPRNYLPRWNPTPVGHRRPDVVRPYHGRVPASLVAPVSTALSETPARKAPDPCSAMPTGLTRVAPDQRNVSCE